MMATVEHLRLADSHARRVNWQRWGPYLSERQWGTVREDYSADGDCWGYLPHDLARSRAYRWGEDGLLGITDRECRLCFALALWNGRDPILKERLFGLTGPEGNHGEDVKECYYYLDSTPTHSYMKALYKYPHTEYPYARLVRENRNRTRRDPEFELADTGVFDGGRYCDVYVEYAKGGPDDIHIRITAANRGPDATTLHVLPTLWFRNTWSWGCTHDGCTIKPRLALSPDGHVIATHPTLPVMRMVAGAAPYGAAPEWMFTENETNRHRCFGVPNSSPYTKDAFHEYVVRGIGDSVNPRHFGTKAAARYVLDIPSGQMQEIRLRLHAVQEGQPHSASNHALPADGTTSQMRDRREDGQPASDVFDQRRSEADAFYDAVIPTSATTELQRVSRQAYAGLLWSKQFYHYAIREWLDGDPASQPPPAARRVGRNADWTHLFNRDVICMPDKWEYPWYAAWDLAFHMIAMAHIDGEFARDQLLLFLREWYMHPNGEIPAYEFALGDVNPPVHAWACWRVYKMTTRNGTRDREFLARAFQKLIINFTWWVNRKDPDGRHLFAGGFLGLDNIGVFDRNMKLPDGHRLEQADGTAWMAFYCGTMLSMALELAASDPTYEDIASKFFEHFVSIADAMNTLGGNGLWNEEDGFYYDHIRGETCVIPLRLRSMVGLVPLFAVEILDGDTIARLPGFGKRLKWFLEHRRDLAQQISYMQPDADAKHPHYLLAIPSRQRLLRVLQHVLSVDGLLAPHGIRSLSLEYRHKPYVLEIDGARHLVEYTAGESASALFGGNSNWRGPIWFPMNYLLAEALERYHRFHGDSFTVELPTGSGRHVTLGEVAREIYARLASIFMPDSKGHRPCHAGDARYASDPHWRDLLLFHEYFNGDDGAGTGASHQTGWTALVTRCIEGLVRDAPAHLSNAAPRNRGSDSAEPAFTARHADHQPIL